MKTKKNYPLFTMLAVLIAHTVLLSLWLADEESVTRKAKFKGETSNEESISVSFHKSNFTPNDSVRINHQQLILSKSFKDNLK